MRILLISGEFPPLQGGVGDYTREMARAYAALGHDVWIAVPQTLAGHYPTTQGERWRALPVISTWSWACWRQILALLPQIRPDILNIQYQAAAFDMRVPAINLLPWRLRRTPEPPPTAVTFHDLKPPYLFPKAGPLRASVVRVLARYSDAVIVTNAEDALAAQSWPWHPRPRTCS